MVSYKMTFLPTYIMPCKFAYYIFECDQAPIILMFAFTLLFSIPFGYISFSMMRSASFLKNNKYLPGLAFIISVTVYIYLEFLFLFAFYRDFHYLDVDLLYRTYFILFDMYNYALSHFFLTICKVIYLFNIPGSKFVYFVSSAVMYICLILFIFRVLVTYMPIPDKYFGIFFNESGSISIFLDVIKFGTLSACIIVLSICFVLSSIKSFLPTKLCAKMKWGIFIFSFSFIISIISEAFTKSIVFYLAQIDVKMQYWYLLAVFFKNYACSYGMLFVISILSISDWDPQKDERSSEINQSFELSL